MSKHTVLFVFALFGLIFLLYYAKVPQQDWAPFQAAGELWVRGEAVYGNHAELSRLYCKYYQVKGDCTESAVTFVSPPLALPVAGLGLNGLVIQLIGVSCLGYAVQRLKLQWEIIPLLWPALQSIMVGQNAPLLVAAAVAPVGWTGFLLALCVAFKLTPVILCLPLMLCRRWRDLTAFLTTIGVLQTICWIRGTPNTGWTDWLNQAAIFNANLASLNGNIAAPEAVRFLVAAMLILSCIRLRKTPVACWWMTWAAWPLLLPLSWWYYAWVTLAAVASSNQPRWVVVMTALTFSACSAMQASLPHSMEWGWLLGGFMVTMLAWTMQTREVAETEKLPSSSK